MATVKMARDTRALKLAQAKWRSSGLSDKAAARLGLKPLNEAETQALHSRFHSARSLYFPYFDLAGEKTKFFRIRYLEQLPGLAGLVEKPQRYAQPPGTLNEIYLPPLIGWQEVADDVSQRIVITEGELKAAAGCANGVPTIGLGGVDVWRSTKRGIEFLPTLNKINWENREVVVVFDSDLTAKPDVIRALRTLSKELLARGAMVRIASLPSAKDGSKQGLDDFIVAGGDLDKLLEDSPALPEAEALWALNQEVIYVKSPGVILERSSGLLFDPNKWKAHVYANRHLMEMQKKGKNEVMVKVQAAPKWIEWERRAEVPRMVYEPGLPQVLQDRSWNIWPGWGLEPKKGDIGPWEWLLDFLFKKDTKTRRWFERWCAYPLQHPGAKLYSAPVLWSPNKGMGKTVLGYTLMRIYGQNSIEIGSKDLKGTFNTWARNRQFVLADEITGSDAKVDSDWLKGLITRLSIDIEEKFLPKYSIRNTINYLFVSNHPDALFIEDHDRRYMVHQIVGPPAERQFYEEYDRWYKGDGPSALFRYLLDLDLGDFNPREHAPETISKELMVHMGKNEMGQWVDQLRIDPASVLKGPWPVAAAKSCDLWTPTLLYRAFDPDGTKRGNPAYIGRAMASAGFRLVNGGIPVKCKAGLQRLWAVRNSVEWDQRTRRECAAHFDSFFGPEVEGSIK